MVTRLQINLRNILMAHLNIVHKIGCFYWHIHNFLCIHTHFSIPELYFRYIYSRNSSFRNTSFHVLEFWISGTCQKWPFSNYWKLEFLEYKIIFKNVFRNTSLVFWKLKFLKKKKRETKKIELYFVKILHCDIFVGDLRPKFGLKVIENGRVWRVCERWWRILRRGRRVRSWRVGHMEELGF